MNGSGGDRDLGLALGAKRSTSTLPGSPTLALMVVLAIFELGWIALHLDRSWLLPDEPREAALTLEMARTNTWAVPTLNGAPFVEKPPLIYAASALASQLASSDRPGVLRVPHLLAALLTIAATFALGRRLGSPSAGLTAAFLLATTSSFLLLSLRLLVDIGLAAFVTASVLCTVEWWLAEDRAHRAAWWIATCACLALGVSTKGPVALGFHATAALGLVVADGRLALGRLAWLTPAYGVALLPLGGWGVALLHHGGRELAADALLRGSWGRFADAELGHAAPAWFYVVNLPLVLAPWSFLAFAGVVTAWKGARERSCPRPRSTLLHVMLSWAIGSALLLTASSSKRQLYLLPAAPAWAILAGSLLDDVARRGHAAGLARRALALTTAALAAASLVGGVYLVTRGRLEAALLLPVAAVFALALQASVARWHPWAPLELLGAMALAWLVVAPALAERETERSIEPARAAVARAALAVDRVYGLFLGERGESLVSLALRRSVPDLYDVAKLGGEEAPLAPRTLVISLGETAPAIEPALRDRATITSAGSVPYGDRHRLFWFTLSRTAPSPAPE